MTALNEERRAQLAVAGEVLDLADHMHIPITQITAAPTGLVSVIPADDADGARLAYAIDGDAPVEHRPATVYHSGFSVWRCTHRGVRVEVLGTVTAEVAL